MKEVYVHRLPNDSMADIGKKIDNAAVEAGVILSAKKRKVLEMVKLLLKEQK